MSAEFCEKIVLQSKQVFSPSGVINKYTGNFILLIKCL